MRRRATQCWIVLTALLVLAGCTYDPAPRAARLQPFLGQPPSVLVASLGVPNRTYDTDGVQFLTYTDRRVEFLSAVPFYGYGWPFDINGPYGYGGFPPQVVDWVCETTVQVAQDRVQSFTFRGNACG